MEISLTHRVFVRYRGVVFDRAREHGELAGPTARRTRTDGSE